MIYHECTFYIYNYVIKKIDKQKNCISFTEDTGIEKDSDLNSNTI